jgi:hypothetical protein
MIGGIATGLAAMLVTGAVILLGWLLGGGSVRDTVEGYTVLRYGPKFRGIGILGVLMGVVVFLVIAVRVVLEYDPPETLFIGIGLLLFFLLLSTPLLLMGFRTAVMLDDSGISFRGALGGSSHVPWEAVENVTYSSMAGGFLVKASGRKMKVPFLLHGREYFVEECKKRVPPDRYGDAFDRPLPPLLL